MDIVGTLEDERVFIVEETPQGFVVTMDEFALADKSRPNELLDVRIGGEPIPWNRRCVLPHKDVIAAVQHFLSEGDTPASLGWITYSEYKRWEKEADQQESCR